MKIDDVSQELLNAMKETNQLKTELKGYDHDCKLNSKGFCKWCTKVETANLFNLRKMASELDNIREDGEYEPPTPSDTAEAISHFGADPDDIGKSKSEIL